MNTLDFLSSDIQFPNDSNEPKLSAAPGSKLPESVDWTFHDFYNTVLEKEFTPIENLTEIKYLEPVKDDYLRDWKQPSIFAMQEKQEDQAVVLVLANTIQTPQSNRITSYQSTINTIKPSSENNNSNNISAALRGALQLVENDMQNNMHDALRSPSSMNNHQNENYISWKEYFFATNLYNNKPTSINGDIDQDLWDDDEIELGPPSPAYHSINDNPILDSSLPSRISSIMMPNTINTTIDQAILNEQPTSVVKVVSSHQPPIPTIQVTSSSETSESSSSSSSESSNQDTTITTPDEHDTIKASAAAISFVEPSQEISSSKKSKSKFSLWKKVKQVTNPLKNPFKSKATSIDNNSSSKNAFKRLFQH